MLSPGIEANNAFRPGYDADACTMMHFHFTLCPRFKISRSDSMSQSNSLQRDPWSSTAGDWCVFICQGCITFSIIRLTVDMRVCIRLDGQKTGVYTVLVNELVLGCWWRLWRWWACKFICHCQLPRLLCYTTISTRYRVLSLVQVHALAKANLAQVAKFVGRHSLQRRSSLFLPITPKLMG